MKAAVLRALGGPLVLEELTVPALTVGQVRVRMQLAAICHSQKLEVAGQRGCDRFLPHLIGHEGVGLVEEIGPSVTKVRAGDQVVLSWIRAAGQAGAPIWYDSSQGRVNAGPVAVFCETPVVSEQCVTRIDPPVAPDVAVLAGCALPTGIGAVMNAMPANANGVLCILGAGGVGLAAVCGAVLAGWRKVIVTDVRRARLQRALALGATHTINADTDDAETAIATLTGGEGCDLVVECAGSHQTMEMAVRLAKLRGGRAVIVGNLEAGQTIAVDPFDLIKGRHLSGSWGGGIDPDRDIPRFVDLATRGIFDYRLLLGKRFTLADVNAALAALDEDEPGRPILDCRAIVPKTGAGCITEEPLAAERMT